MREDEKDDDRGNALTEKGVILFGAGTTGRLVADLLKNTGIAIRCFLDNYADISSQDGIAVHRPDAAPLTREERERAIVVVSIGGIPGFDPEEERKRFFSYGYKLFFSLPEFHAYFQKELRRLFSSSQNTYTRNMRRITAVRERLSDEKSRIVLDKTIEYRCSLNPDNHPKIEGDYYFPKDIPPWKQPLRLADCGAYDGDTIRYLMANDIPTELVVAFEPDPATYEKLAAFARRKAAQRFPVICLPIAVGDDTAIVQFDGGRGTGSKQVADGNGNISVPMARVDRIMSGISPTLIKMDVEGGEKNALRGCEDLFADSSPGLAISIYHHPSDLWELPELIFELTRGKPYEYFIRCHCIYTTDLVFYALPK